MKKINHLDANGKPIRNKTVVEQDGKWIEVDGDGFVYTTVTAKELAALRRQNLQAQVDQVTRELYAFAKARDAAPGRAQHPSKLVVYMSEDDALELIARKAGIEYYAVEDVADE